MIFVFNFLWLSLVRVLGSSSFSLNCLMIFLCFLWFIMMFFWFLMILNDFSGVSNDCIMIVSYLSYDFLFWFSNDFLFLFRFSLHFLWLYYACLLSFCIFSDDVTMIFLWFYFAIVLWCSWCYNVLMIVLWCSYDFFWNFLQLSYDFLFWLSYDLFIWFFHFLLIVLWLSYDFIMIFLCFLWFF